MLYQLSYTPQKRCFSKTWLVRKIKEGGVGSGLLLIILKGRGSVWGSYCRASEENVRARVSTPARKRHSVSAPYFKLKESLYIYVMYFSAQAPNLYKGLGLAVLLNKHLSYIRFLACFHSLKILSTKEGQRGILKLLSLTPSTRRWGRLSFQPPVRLKALKTEKGRSSYLCNYGLCWPLFRSSTLFSLSNSVLPNKTDFSREGLWNQIRRMNLYLCTEVAGRRPLNSSSAMQWWLVPIRQR